MLHDETYFSRPKYMEKFNMKYDEILDELHLSVKSLTGKEKDELVETIKTVQEKISEIGLNILKVKETPDKDVYFNRADIYGINQCMHLASSFVLLGSKSETLKEVIHKVRTECSNINCEVDPTTIISVAALYYLLSTDDESEHEKGIRVLKERFEKIGWMVGQDVKQNYLQFPSI